MKRTHLLTAGVVFLSLLMAAALPVPAAADEPILVEIQIAPNVINLQSTSAWVTVHVDIRYGDVDALTVALNGVAISWDKADDLGYFVAKFDADKVKEVLTPGADNLLTLTGKSTGGTDFTGFQYVYVLDGAPGKK